MGNSFKSLWDRYLELSLPMKILIGSFLGSVAGPGVIGLFSEYATYSYALNYGFRPPLEGVPYLQTAITTASLFGALCIFAIFLFAKYVTMLTTFIICYIIIPFAYIALIFVRIFTKKYSIDFFLSLSNSLKNVVSQLSTKGFIIHLIFQSVVSFSAVFVIQSFTPLKSHFVNEVGVYYVSIIFTILIVLSNLTARNKKYVWLLFILLSLVFYITSFWALFNSKVYASILRTAGYGGGVRIELHISDNESNIRKEVCYLLIRTKEVLVCMDEAKNYISEFPASDIEKVSYRTVERTLQTYQLPENNPQ